MRAGFDCDVAIVGSGFGGAVSALRLAEKGYDVVVLEQGRRLAPADLQKARHDLRAHMWDPDLGLHGFFWQRVFRDVGIIGASGVGGGSIVWGAVLLQPDAGVFADPAWGDAERDWHAAMEPHYAQAARMLGRTTNPFTGPMDEHLRAAAKVVGGEETFGPVPLAVYFGEEGRTVPDPFFGGEGPERTGCRLCGGCLTGCPYGAKNTLDLNYLHLAERRGAQIRPEHKVVALAPLPGGGYELQSVHPWRRGVRHPPLRARQVVLAAGVLGTLELLFRCRDELGTLPRVSPRLGERVRTNSEAVTVVLDADPATDLTRGPSISTDFHPDARTHITQNRYVGGGKLLRWQVGPLVDGERPGPRAVATLRAIARAPLTQLRAVTARNFEGRLTALTVMQDLDNELRFVFGRSPVRPWRRVLRSRAVPGRETPSYLPVANEAARAFAASSGGTPMNLLVESAGGRSVTAHVLGGAVMGESAADGVVDGRHEVHGHPGLFVADASAIPVNLGVNPSLTITALAERFASQWPARETVPAEAAGGDRAGGGASAESRHMSRIDGAGDETSGQGASAESRRVSQMDDSAGSAVQGSSPGRRPGAGGIRAAVQATHAELPASLGALRRRWGALPAPPVEALLGTRRAVFVGPRALRAVAPRGLGLLGLPRWFGKRFEATAAGVHGVNLLHDDGGLRAHLEMRADIQASRLDGAPALVVTYGQDAPLPWRHIRDEFRTLEDGTLLGMTVLDVPGARKAGTPFLLEVAAPTVV